MKRVITFIKYQSSHDFDFRILSTAVSVEIKEELKLEPVDDSRCCFHTFHYSPRLKSTHLIHD